MVWQQNEVRIFRESPLTNVKESAEDLAKFTLSRHLADDAHRLSQLLRLLNMHIKGARLLVVEDDPILGNLWVDIMGHAGAIVAGPCATVVEAMKQIEKHQPIIALLDIQLLDGPSFPVARALAAAGIPFLFLSADDPKELPAEFAGSPYLRKPVGVRDLMHTLEHV